MAAVTVHLHGITDIQTSIQAGEALRPIAGEYIFLLFSVRIAGIVESPIMRHGAENGAVDIRLFTIQIARICPELLGIVNRFKGRNAHGGPFIASPEYPGFREIYQQFFMLVRTQKTIGTDGDYVPQALNIAFLGPQVENKLGHFLTSTIKKQTSLYSRYVTDL